MSQNNTTVIVGTVHAKTDKQQVSEKFAKQELVIQTDGEYPQYITVQFNNDKCSLVDNLSEGQHVEVSCNVRGRAWDGPQGRKYFNTLEGWRVNTTAATHQPEVHKAQVVTPYPEPNDDLPF